MSLHLQRIADVLQSRSELGDDRKRRRINRIGAGWKEGGLLEADDQTAWLHGDFDFAGLDFVPKLLGKALERRRQFENVRRRRFFVGLLRPSGTPHLSVALPFVVHGSAK